VDDLAVVDAHVRTEVGAAHEVLRRQVFHPLEIAVGELRKERRAVI
jgi:hypothetical protein